MNKNVLIVNYNTTLLTQCCIKSVNKFTPGCKIYVFDNSDKEPFVNVFKNVEVIDNTKGQIIDFEKWLNKYKDKKKSNAKINNWGSAKHCYTVEKCMKLINEPFVLLDSDVLLKKDISELFNEKYVYIGKVEKQPHSTIKRVIPYCCFINTKMCNENNIHYFNENRMHGLYKIDVVKNADSYDTGSNFYLESEKLQHKEIKYEDYIEHFSGGSWDEVKSKRINRKITDDEWLIMNKKLWNKNINICIIHYNTPYLTECLVKSINKFVPSSTIYIFDNSDKEVFTYRQDNIVYFDNTKGQIINFDEWLNEIKTKVTTPNNYASAKHCYTIEKCMELIKEPFILLDSDVLLKKDITELYDEQQFYVGDVEKWLGNERVIPYCCFINTTLCKEKDIHYYNEKYIVGLTAKCHYDTGAWFWKECKDLPHKNIKFKDYVVHMDDGSQRYKNLTKQKSFLELNKSLWEDSEVVEENKNEIVMENNKIEEYKRKLIRTGKTLKLNFNLDNPQTIQDKIQWLKLHDSTPLKTRCADKIKVHNYCKEKLGKDICIPILKVYNNTNEINWDELPQQFVIKCNHGSGMNIIVKDKSKMNKTDVVNKLNKWMNTDFAFQNGCELHYHDIEHKIFVEKFEEDSSQKDSLLDYKFWCFNGEPKFMTVSDGFGHGRMTFFDMNFNEINISRTDFKKLDNVKKPNNFKLMVEYAKKLSEDFKFVRVDFYEINSELYLGELTFTPGSGFFKYKDEKDNYRVGDMLDLKKEPHTIKNKKVVYTCICGNYDTLLEPEFISKGFDYVCFTDQPFTSNTWQIRQIPEELNELTQVKRQRNIKINAHKYLPEYDFSVWVDANTTLKGDINKYIEKNCNKEGVVLYVGKHPQRDCIYKEGDACIKIRKDTKENVNRQMEFYKKEGFPEHYGLPQSCIILRYHNDEKCKRLMETWWGQVKEFSHRDQLSFNYALWKNQDVKIGYLDKSIFDCECFKWGKVHKKVKVTKTSEKPKVVQTVSKVTQAVIKPVVEHKLSTVIKKVESIKDFNEETEEEIKPVFTGFKKGELVAKILEISKSFDNDIENQ